MSIGQGKLYWVEFDGEGHQYKGRRPALVVQADAVTKRSNMVTVVPVSAQMDNEFPGDVLIEKNNTNNLYKDSLAKMTHIQTFSKNRLKKEIGNVSDDVMREVKKQLKAHFDL